MNEWPSYYSLLLGYLILINAVTFIIYALDKLFAVSATRRVSEKILLGLALCGGSLGSLAAITLFRHKTRKHSFLIWFILIALLHVLAIFYFFEHMWMKVG